MTDIVVGAVFTRLTVRSVTRGANHHGVVTMCDCACGTQDVRVRASQLRAGTVKSCGCLRQETSDNFFRRKRQDVRGGRLTRRSAWANNDDIDEFLGG